MREFQEKDFEVEPRLRPMAQIVKSANDIRNPKFNKEREKVQEIGNDGFNWVVENSRKNFLNGRRRLTLVALSGNEETQQVPPSVVLSVKIKNGEIKDVVVLEDKKYLYNANKDDIISAVESHVLQSDKIEEVLNQLN